MHLRTILLILVNLYQQILLLMLIHCHMSICVLSVLLSTAPLVTVDDVMTVISQLNNSAAGHDGLPASIMKKLSNDYLILLTHCIDMSIVQSDFPDQKNNSESHTNI